MLKAHLCSLPQISFITSQLNFFSFPLLYCSIKELNSKIIMVTSLLTFFMIMALLYVLLFLPVQWLIRLSSGIQPLICNISSRILHDHRSASGIHSQTMDTMRNRMEELEGMLAREQQAHKQIQVGQARLSHLSRLLTHIYSLLFSIMLVMQFSVEQVYNDHHWIEIIYHVS